MRALTPVRRLVRSLGFVTGLRRSVRAVPELLEGLLVLPRLADHLERVVHNTDVLRPMAADLSRVAANTDHLSAIAAHPSGLVTNTAVLPDMRSELIVMWGAIVDLGGDTGQLGEYVSKLVSLEQSVPPVLPVLRDVDAKLTRLMEIIEPLAGASSRLGRFADRLPSRSGAHANGRHNGSTSAR
jgi:hypothetical protein